MTFDVKNFAREIEARCPQVAFALLHGSAAGGEVRAGSDIDVALYVTGTVDWDLYSRVMEIGEGMAPGVTIDIGILNRAEPVYRFEALKGRLLFCRDQETYLRFFSLTCREYESSMVAYRRQQGYRRAG